MDDVLCVLVFLYSLAGKQVLEDEEQESNLQEVLIDRIMEEKEELPPIVKSIGDSVHSLQ